MPKKTTEYSLLPLFRKYINEIKKGKHIQKNGKRIRTGSIENYLYTEKLLHNFCAEKNFALRIRIINIQKKSEFEAEKKYWKSFYTSFTNYLYDDLGHYDNYVGSVIKLIRAFFNYLYPEKGINTGTFHKNFFVPSEEIQIIVLSPERLNFLIYSKELENKLPANLKPVKDVFILGCSVALRFSDLMALTKTNLETINNRSYLNVQSKKTQTFTRVKLPDYAINILNKYKNDPKKRLIPEFNKTVLNKKIKKLMEIAGWTEPFNKTRLRRGMPIKIYKETKSKEEFRFCDMITTHTMRRTAITTMLSLGMNEQMVRKISGHASGSKEFYRYVSFAQNYIDNEIDQMHEKLEKKQLEMV